MCQSPPFSDDETEAQTVKETLTSHSLWEAEVGFAPGSLVPEPVLFTTISHTEYNYAVKIMYTEFYKSN